jgi:hypothetical protein
MHGKKFYAVRDKKGRFTDITNIGDSIREDSQQKAKKKVKPGHGHEGDLLKR